MLLFKALMAVFVFAAASGWGLHALGVGEHHNEILWALGTSVALLTILLIGVWLFFKVAGEDLFKWD